MVAISASNKVAGVAEGQTFTVNSQHGVVAGNKDAFGSPLSVTAVSTGRSWPAEIGGPSGVPTGRS
jgi:hypothetical protein